VASLLLAVAVGNKHNCTTTIAIVVAETTTVGIAGDCPNTTVEGDIASLRVGYTPYSSLEEHH
jgi:hypothetical protein